MSVCEIHAYIRTQHRLYDKRHRLYHTDYITQIESQEAQFVSQETDCITKIASQEAQFVSQETDCIKRYTDYILLIESHRLNHTD